MATKVYGATYWQQQVRRMPTWALEEELMRREADLTRNHPAGPTVQLPGIVVDPFASTVLWRGDEYQLTGRQMEVVYAIALARQQGRRRVRCLRIGLALFRGWERDAARKNVQVLVAGLRKKIPGLLDRQQIGMEVAYGLVLDEPATAAVDAA